MLAWVGPTRATHSWANRQDCRPLPQNYVIALLAHLLPLIEIQYFPLTPSVYSHPEVALDGVGQPQMFSLFTDQRAGC